MKSMTPILLSVCFLLSICLLQQPAGAALSPVSGSTSDPVAYGTNINNVIDGVIDFDSNLALGTAGYGVWGGPYTVRFDLGASFNLASFNLWNNAGSIEMDGEGVHRFELMFFDDAQSQVGETFSSYADDVLNEQNFSIYAVGVRYVDFVIIDTHSTGTGVNSERGYAHFYEVSFDQVPIPSTISLLSIGLVIFAGMKRKNAQT